MHAVTATRVPRDAPRSASNSGDWTSSSTTIAAGAPSRPTASLAGGRNGSFEDAYEPSPANTRREAEHDGNRVPGVAEEEDESLHHADLDEHERHAYQAEVGGRRPPAVDAKPTPPEQRERAQDQHGGQQRAHAEHTAEHGDGHRPVDAPQRLVQLAEVVQEAGPPVVLEEERPVVVDRRDVVGVGVEELRLPAGGEGREHLGVGRVRLDPRRREDDAVRLRGHLLERGDLVRRKRRAFDQRHGEHGIQAHDGDVVGRLGRAQVVEGPVGDGDHAKRLPRRGEPEPGHRQDAVVFEMGEQVPEGLHGVDVVLRKDVRARGEPGPGDDAGHLYHVVLPAGAPHEAAPLAHDGLGQGRLVDVAGELGVGVAADLQHGGIQLDAGDRRRAHLVGDEDLVAAAGPDDEHVGAGPEQHGQLVVGQRGQLRPLDAASDVGPAEDVGLRVAVDGRHLDRIAGPAGEEGVDRVIGLDDVDARDGRPARLDDPGAVELHRLRERLRAGGAGRHHLVGPGHRGRENDGDGHGPREHPAAARAECEDNPRRSEHGGHRQESARGAQRLDEVVEEVAAERGAGEVDEIDFPDAVHPDREHYRQCQACEQERRHEQGVVEGQGGVVPTGQVEGVQSDARGQCECRDRRHARRRRGRGQPRLPPGQDPLAPGGEQRAAGSEPEQRGRYHHVRQVVP